MVRVWWGGHHEGPRAGLAALSVLVMALATSLGAGTSWAQTTFAAPVAHVQGPSSACANAQLRTFASTDRRAYRTGATVHLRATITNVSTRSCSVVVGGTSPTLTIYNAAGIAQWSYCDSLVVEEMCPLYLRVVVLAPHASFSASNAWAMSAGAHVAPPGRYRLAIRFRGVAMGANSYFEVGTVGAAPLVVSEAQSGTHVSLLRGQLLVVRFSHSLFRWSPIQSSNPHVLEASASGVSFRALAVGSATLRATGTPTCYPQCLVASRLFQLSVTVRR